MKKQKLISVMIDENHESLIDAFIAKGGVYDNINNGILLEPLFEVILSDYFNQPIRFVGQYGYDYASLDKIIKIESKVLTMSPSSATLKNFGDIKDISGYLLIYHPIMNKLFIMDMNIAKKLFITGVDITNNKTHVCFTNNLTMKRMWSSASQNSFILEQYADILI